MTKLYELPPEILSQICSNLSSANTIANISACNHQLNNFIQEEGWRIFCRTHFPSLLPSLSADINYSAVSQSVTAQSRSWDRRSILARFLNLQFARSNGWQQYRQTMGFQPVIDSQEVLVGGEWLARNEYLVVGAGPQLYLRLKRKGFKCEDGQLEGYTKDQHGYLERSITLQDVDAKDGHHDYTGLSLFSRTFVEAQVPKASDECVIALAGTASGSIEVKFISLQPGNPTKSHILDASNTTTVRSVDISPSEKLCAAASADRIISLFRINHDIFGEEASKPLYTHEVSPKFNHLWTSTFLDDHQIVFGSGRVEESIQLHPITESGISSTATRTWHLLDKHSKSPGAVHCIYRLPNTFSSAGSTSHLFLSGNSDGTVRLHDLRSSEDTVASFTDPISDDSILSLATKGQERIIAGSNMNSLIKLFDVRLPGCKVYNYQSPSSPQNLTHGTSSSFSLFLNPIDYEPPQHPRTRSRNNWRNNNNIQNRRATNSPVYSLASPSPYSPTLYVGLEGSIAQLDVVDVFEKFPDPVFNACSLKDGPRGFWDAKGDVRNLALYEHDRWGLLRKQGWPSVDGMLKMKDMGYDARWVIS